MELASPAVSEMSVYGNGLKKSFSLSVTWILIVRQFFLLFVIFIIIAVDIITMCCIV